MTLSENILDRNNIELIAIDEVFTQIRNWNKYFFSNYGRLIHQNNKGKYCIVNPSITDGGYFTYTEILRQYFINNPQSIDKYTFLQNSAFTHWVKEKCSKMC